jgi:hypothetical protein
VPHFDKFVLYHTDAVEKWKFFPGALSRLTGEIYWQSGTLVYGFEITKIRKDTEKETNSRSMK